MTALPWASWLEQDRASVQPRMVRPSLWLPATLVERLDRVSRIQQVSRSELAAYALDRWLASWRPLHDERRGL